MRKEKPRAGMGFTSLASILYYVMHVMRMYSEVMHFESKCGTVIDLANPRQVGSKIILARVTHEVAFRRSHRISIELSPIRLSQQ